RLSRASTPFWGASKTWMAGTSPAMTNERSNAGGNRSTSISAAQRRASRQTQQAGEAFAKHEFALAVAHLGAVDDSQLILVLAPLGGLRPFQRIPVDPEKDPLRADRAHRFRQVLRGRL